MSDVWFTSDTHFNHRNIIQYSNRPYRTIEDMNEGLIESWNARVKPNDEIYHLGDFALGKSDTIEPLLKRLNGCKYLIVGNHDGAATTRAQGWNRVRHYDEIRIGGQLIVLCHYAMRVWCKSHRGSWHLYGHSHGSLPDIGGKTIDVGVDVQNYEPISFDEVRCIMRDRDVIVVDHHAPNRP